MSDALQAVGFLTCVGGAMFIFISCIHVWVQEKTIKQLNTRLTELENKR